ALRRRKLAARYDQWRQYPGDRATATRPGAAVLRRGEGDRRRSRSQRSDRRRGGAGNRAHAAVAQSSADRARVLAAAAFRRELRPQPTGVHAHADERLHASDARGDACARCSVLRRARRLAPCRAAARGGNRRGSLIKLVGSETITEVTFACPAAEE